jgi:hypothetical protein
MMQRISCVRVCLTFHHTCGNLVWKTSLHVSTQSRPQRVLVARGNESWMGG